MGPVTTYCFCTEVTSTHTYIVRLPVDDQVSRNGSILS